jgi:L-fuconate dehydratase
VNHLIMVDHARIACSHEGRVAEWVDHLHEHFESPCVVGNGRYMPPTAPGYGITMKRASLDAHAFPGGPVWSARRAAKR